MDNITKVCKDCNIEKTIEYFFYTKGRINTMCKDCKRIRAKINRDKPENKEKIKSRNNKWNKDNKDYFKEYHDINDRSEYRKEYKEKNPNKILEWSRNYRDNNKDYIDEYQREYRKNNPDKAKQYYINSKDYYKEYYDTNKDFIKDKQNLYFKERKQNDPLFKLSCNIRTLVNISLTKKGYSKESKTYDIVGCSYELLMEHMQSKFEDWMNWENHGLYNGELNYGWDIDHIIPISSAETEEDIIMLNHYSNLQPLCSYTNRHIKRNIL